MNFWKKIPPFVSLLALALPAPAREPGKKPSSPPVEVRRAEAVVPGPRIARAAPIISPNDEARFLAGLPVSGPLQAQVQTGVWQAHAAAMHEAWTAMEARQLNRVRTWAFGVPQGETLFYFFSGPDFLYADLLFPNTTNYVLCAMEPVGAVGDLWNRSEPELANTLGLLRRSMSTLLRVHYFITKELRADLSQPQLGGTLPLLFVFLARSGHTIREVVPIKDGVRIQFTSASGAQKTLFYYRVDLSNAGRNAAFFEFCRGFRDATALLKSASYLLHQPGFSRCREFLLQQPRAIVQDDTGLPFAAFQPQQWMVRLFGSYRGTEGIFAKYHQPDLLEAYRVQAPPPLGFSFGYDANRERAALMIATRR